MQRVAYRREDWWLTMKLMVVARRTVGWLRTGVAGYGGGKPAGDCLGKTNILSSAAEAGGWGKRAPPASNARELLNGDVFTAPVVCGRFV